MLSLGVFVSLALLTSAEPPLLSVVGSRTLLSAIAPRFVSVSMEVPCAAPFLVDEESRAPRAAFTNVMSLLRGWGGSGPELRVGGSSGDFSWYARSGTPLPRGDTYRITSADIAALPTVRLYNGTVVATLNFRNATAPAATHLAALAIALGWDDLRAEIGNEVDAYAASGIRGPDYTATVFAATFAAYVASLTAGAQLPPGRVQGAVYTGWNASFLSSLPSFIAAARPSLASISVHNYGIGGCSGKPISMEQLLGDAAVAGNVAHLAPSIAATRAAGLPFHVGESNTISCGGRAGLSDAFGAALWGVDYFLALAAAGVARVNVHHGCPTAHYSPLLLNASAGTLTVRPIFYALWAVANVSASVGATAVSSSITNADAAPVRVHTLLDAAGTWRVVAVHKGVNASAVAPVTVRALPPPAAHPAAPLPVAWAPAARLTRLAPVGPEGAAARSGIVFGGLTLDNSTDGHPTGTPTSETVPAGTDGAYTFILQPSSVAILALEAVAAAAPAAATQAFAQAPVHGGAL